MTIDCYWSRSSRDAYFRMKKPSPAMLAMLKNLANGKDAFSHLNGRAEMGGGMKTIYALLRHGLLESISPDVISDKGRKALEGAKCTISR